ncbi:MAG: trypsin-like peptidase domain-containing protein [Saprospiraceae bacterium]
MKNLFLFLFIWASLSSCASMLNPKFQKVEIQTNSSDAKVNVDNEYKGKGRVVLEDAQVQKLLDQQPVLAPAFESLSIQTPDVLVKDVESALQASVTIQHDKGHGRGLVISPEGFLITNYNVVAGHETVEVILHDKTKHEARVTRVNEEADLALLKVDTQFDATFVLPTDKHYRVGQEVFSIGTPTSVELGQTVSKGIISGLRQHDALDWLQTDVSINFGNSGGPLIDDQGRLIGIVNSKVIGFGVEGIAFAIPASEVFSLLGVSY